MSEEQTETPSEPFLRACEDAGIGPDDREALWRLHRLRPKRDQAAQENIEELIADHAHWRLYLASRMGDAGAARRFERTWTRAARAYLGRGFGADQVDELAARFFERVYRLVGSRFDWKSPFSIYLRKVLLNVARDSARRHSDSRRREVSLDTPETLAVRSTEPSPEQRLLAEERRAQVRQALWQVPPVDRNILRVCLMEGGSGQELAAELGISRDALYQRLRRAKKRLQKLLEAQGVTSDP